MTSLDVERYLSADTARREWAALWPATWLLAGPLSHAGRPGDWFTFELGPFSVLVAAGPDGKVRAFHNVCSHRGRRLVEEPAGRSSALRCPYHGWSFRCDGRLIHVPDQHLFEPDLTDRRGLKEVECDLWGGFVWIRFSSGGPPLGAWLEPVIRGLDAYDTARFTLVDDASVEVPCNWKLAVDAFLDTYHLQALHRSALATLDDTAITTETHGMHLLQVVPMAVPSPRAPAPAGSEARWLLEEAGVPDDATGRDGGSGDLRTRIRRALRNRDEAERLGLSPLSNEQLTDLHSWFVFPNVVLQARAMSLTVHRVRPAVDDMARCVFDQQTYLRAAVSPPAGPVGRRSEGSLGRVTDEDLANLRRVQEGIRSRAFDRILLGRGEKAVAHFHDRLDGYLSGPPPGRHG